MFRKIRHSLIARVVCLSFAGVLLTTFAVIWAVTWIFERSLDTQLDNHLTAHTDIVISATYIENGKVVVDKDNTILKSIPRHWQIDTNEKHIARSHLLKNWLPLNPIVNFEPERVLFKNNRPSPLVAVRQAFQFANNEIVVITFGLEEHITETYKKQLRSQFNKNSYKTLFVVAIVIVITGVIQVLVIASPLKKIRVALQQVRMGQKDRIKGQLPLEVQLLSDEINHLLDYIEGVIKRHRTFSSNLSHALKTPLTVIRGETNSQLIHEQIDTMLQVIDRNLSKSQSACPHNILSAKTPIKPVIERICNGFNKIYLKDIKINCPENVIFYGNESDLFEALGNLIENACKYGESKVSITANKQAIIIEDNGSGIPKLAYNNVLERGVRIDTSKNGAGLGLSITKDIIELYGGELILDQSTMGGLKVIFRLSTT